MGVVGLLADAVEEIDPVFPFLFRQLNLADEGMHMLDEGFGDFTDAGARRPGHGLEDGGCYVIFVVDDHRRSSSL